MAKAYGTHFGLLTSKPNEHVAAASIQLQADEILAEAFATVCAFGSCLVYETPSDGQIIVEPDFGDGDFESYRPWLELCRCDDGYLVRYRQRYGESYTQVVTYDQANKVC